MTINARRREVALTLATLSLLSAGHAKAEGRGINESGFHKVGGIDQWISIQGHDTAKPAILYLHGGPAEAQSPFLKEFLPWQDDYTVVNWDQRGSGKTYGKNGASTPGMNTAESAVEQLVTDAVEVATIAAQREQGHLGWAVVGNHPGSARRQASTRALPRICRHRPVRQLGAWDTGAGATHAPRGGRCPRSADLEDTGRGGFPGADGYAASRRQRKVSNGAHRS